MIATGLACWVKAQSRGFKKGGINQGASCCKPERRNSGYDIWRQRILKPRHAITQGQFALFEPLHLQLIHAAKGVKSGDGCVQIAVLLLQRLKFGLECNAFFMCQAIAHAGWTFETSRPGGRKVRQRLYYGRACMAEQDCKRVRILARPHTCD